VTPLFLCGTGFVLFQIGVFASVRKGRGRVLPPALVAVGLTLMTAGSVAAFLAAYNPPPPVVVEKPPLKQFRYIVPHRREWRGWRT
jgi:hypothetical protein